MFGVRMKASELQPGDIVMMDGIKHEMKFVRREPRSGSFGARNIFICEEWAGIALKTRAIVR